MKMIDKSELAEIKKQNSFFDFEELSNQKNQGNEFSFKLDMDNPRDYPDVIYRINNLVEVISKMLSSLNQQVIIFNYQDKWLTQDEEVYPLRKLFFDKYGIDNFFDGAIEVDSSDEIVKYFLESVFKYNSFVGFLSENSIGKVVIVLSDHLDVFVHTDRKEVSDEIKRGLTGTEEGIEFEIN
ncbi:hypothetical protein Q2T76_01620 [Lactobacillus sp. YT155]|uniref:hypothetical protein n=1 Tax=Lactobacillus sp. YT155 TaxID=3060955 RepID=UPI00265ED725|nr:hypothetical protein [Lactobacillus sp. YT155]MDO1604750.1 hypothetical protein [Lactobacillus sp. YT155]